MSTKIVASVPGWLKIAQHVLHKIPLFSTFSNALVETKTTWIILPESNDCLRLFKLCISISIAWPVLPNVCFKSLSINHVKIECFCVDNGRF